MARRAETSLRICLWDSYTDCPELIKNPCFCCNKLISAFEFEVGHVIPDSQGGARTLQNCRPICRACNGQMSAKHLFTWMSTVGYKRPYCLHGSCQQPADCGWFCQSHQGQLNSSEFTTPNLSNLSAMRRERDNKKMLLDSLLMTTPAAAAAAVSVPEVVSTAADGAVASSIKGTTSNTAAINPQSAVSKAELDSMLKHTATATRPKKTRYSSPSTTSSPATAEATASVVINNSAITANNGSDEASLASTPLAYPIPNTISASGNDTIGATATTTITTATDSDAGAASTLVEALSPPSCSSSSSPPYSSSSSPPYSSSSSPPVDNGDNIIAPAYNLYMSTVCHYITDSSTTSLRQPLTLLTTRSTASMLYKQLELPKWCLNPVKDMKDQTKMAVIVEDRNDTITISSLACSYDTLAAEVVANRTFLIQDKTLYVLPTEVELQLLKKLDKQGCGNQLSINCLLSAANSDSITTVTNNFDLYHKLAVNYFSKVLATSNKNKIAGRIKCADSRAAFFYLGDDKDTLTYIDEADIGNFAGSTVCFLYFDKKQYYRLDTAKAVLTMLSQRTKLTVDGSYIVGGKHKADVTSSYMHECLASAQLNQYKVMLPCDIALFTLLPATGSAN